MKILKFIVVEFEKTFDLKHFQRKTEKTIIKFHSTYQNQFGESFIFSGEQNNIEYKCFDNIIQIANDLINIISNDLEDTINLISLSKISGKKIFSCQPSIFLESECDVDSKKLKKVSKLELTNPVNVAQISVTHLLNFETCLNSLGDRLDGVKIFSEALSANSTSGKFREYIRLFERAFNKENRALIKPLSLFLGSAKKLEYNEDEIRNWISIRHRLNHSNNKEGFLIDREIIHYIPRVEQAAYDILFNKKLWANKSLDRKDLFQFKKRIDKDNRAVVKTKSNEDIGLILYDETRTFPVSFMARFEPNKIPKEWWYEGDGKYTLEKLIKTEKD